MSSFSSMRGIVCRNKELDKWIKNHNWNNSWQVIWNEVTGDCWVHRIYANTEEKAQPKNTGEVSMENDKLFHTAGKLPPPIWNGRGKRQE